MPNIRLPRRMWPMLTALAALAGIALTPLTACTESTAPPRGRVVLLGGLFDLTGNWSTLGEASKAAMELAVEDVNQYLAGNAADLEFAAAVENTRLDPDTALQKAQALRARGIQLLIGPQSSAEVARLKPFVDANGLLLVSQSSTAGSLAIAGDNVFRFTPTDSMEGVAISALMWDDGVRVVVPVWRDDPGNAGLVTAVRARFAALGGTVLEGLAYDAHTTDFTATADNLADQVDAAIRQHGRGAVAVYLAAFDEVVALFGAATPHPILGSVAWYGSDGVANSAALVGDRTASEFAVRVGYPSPAFAVEEGARDIWQPLAERIRARTGRDPDAYALTVYDAVWVIARGYVASGATSDIEKLKHAFTTAASTHYGATGWCVLNAAGDRKYGDFAYWAIRMDGGAPHWERVAHYESRTGRLVRLPAPTQTTSLRGEP
ncbi:MAG TPA: ABC transporter substrate-binding protein [Gemmatimonadaceae bacterium]|nr:ABC transporter substrate-binding protein [Gemmatimonadaceae bacterium]